MESQNLSKHEHRKLKLEQKKLEKLKAVKEAGRTERNRKLLNFGIAGIAIIVGIALLALAATQQGNSPTANFVYPATPVHWHATPIISVCGEAKQIPLPAPGQHLGTGLLHTHEDALIHIEGTITDSSQITLGVFFSSIGVKFSETEIMDKKNGDACPNGLQGKVSMEVNSQANNEFENHIIKDGDKISIKFE